MLKKELLKKLKKLVVEDGFDLIEEYENNTNKNGISLRIFFKERRKRL